MLSPAKKMNKFLITINALLLLLSISACATPPTVTIEDENIGDNLNVKFSIISQGSHSNISLPNQLVIKNKKDWQRLLLIHNDPRTSDSASIDFQDKIVIAIFAGQQPSGGYTVGVSNIKRINENLFLTLSFTEPKRNDSVSLALTQPFIILSTNKVDGKIVFLTPEHPVR